MMLIFLFLIIFSFYCSYKNYVSRHSFGFLSIIWSLIGLIYISMHKVACLDNYESVKLFNQLDFSLFMLLIKPRFSLFTLTRLFNICSIWYMLSLILFSLSYVQLSRKQKLLFTFPSAIFAVGYMLFYEPQRAYHAYLQTAYTGSRTVFNRLVATDFVFWICVIFIFLLPWFIFLRNYKSLRSPYSKKQIVGVSLFVLFTNIMYIIIYRITNIRVIYILHNIWDIISPRTFRFNFNYIYIMLMFICIGCMAYVLASFNIAQTDGFLKKLIIKAQIKNKNAETHKILHSVKNMIISYNILLEDALHTSGDEKDRKLASLHDKMNDYLNHISSLVSSEHSRDDFWQEKTTAEDFMDEIIAKVEVPEGAELEKLYNSQNSKIYIDTFYLEEAVTNILDNAIQATLDAGGGKISIDIKPELSWISISISDMGKGIARHIRKSIFKPFFTTKLINTNWGIGLSYALEIITMHGGKISFKSRPGHGTTFFILLPKQKN